MSVFTGFRRDEGTGYCFGLNTPPLSKTDKNRVISLLSQCLDRIQSNILRSCLFVHSPHHVGHTSRTRGSTTRVLGSQCKKNVAEGGHYSEVTKTLSLWFERWAIVHITLSRFVQVVSQHRCSSGQRFRYCRGLRCDPTLRASI